MRRNLKSFLAASIACVCLAGTVFAESTGFSVALDPAGAVYTSARLKKEDHFAYPEINVTRYINYANSTDYPITARVREADTSEPVTAAIGVSSTGRYIPSYYVGRGTYGQYYRLRLATHTQSPAGAEIAGNFVP